MKFLSNEVVAKKEEKVEIEAGVVVSSDKIVKAVVEAENKFTMAHGSHRQHSSSGTY